VSWSTYLIRTCVRAAELGERTQWALPQHERRRLDARPSPHRSPLA
jgi:hypothetical protein